MNRIVLGRGIGALIPDGSNSQAQTSTAEWADVPINQIQYNPDQPRQDLDRERLASLALSIRKDGVLQPVLVQAKADGFELIAGERRVRAAESAGLTSVPARVLQNIDSQKRAILALVENLQREDLNPLEEARGYRELMDKFGLSQDDLAAAVGKDRSTVANTLRMLNLPDRVQSAIVTGQLSAGHGRALLSLPDAEQIEKTAQKVIKEGWSVRQLERELTGGRPKRGRRLKAAGSKRWSALEDALRRKFGTQVNISHRLGRGKIVFEYYSEEDLTRLVDLFEVRLD